MTQLSLALSPDDRYAEMAREYASLGNIDMCNMYLHKWACEVDGHGVDEVVAELREAARGRCLHPESIGDPDLFGGRA
jgi:hypothetical protein